MTTSSTMTMTSWDPRCCCSLALATQWVSSVVYRSATTSHRRWKVLPTFPFWMHCTAVVTVPRMRNLLPAKEYLRHCRLVSFRPRDRARS